MEPTIQRWSAKRKVERLLALIKGEKKLVDACREYNLRQSEVEEWMDTLVVSGQVVYEMARVTRVDDVYATALLLDDAVVVGSGSVTTSGVGRSSVSTVR